ncbi:MAG: GNAT family N-acetyltransferase [Candidatus Bathyarchaeia archaeon]
MLITIKKADRKDIEILSEKLLSLLEDKNSQVYMDNVAKFGIPEDYVKKAFAKETLLNAVFTRKATFYLAISGDEIIGFAQTIQQDAVTTELDRIIVFPQYTRKGIGALLLGEVIKDQKQMKIKSIIVKAGKEENHARRFYEKNGFKQIGEMTINAPWSKKLELVTYQLCLEP